MSQIHPHRVQVTQEAVRGAVLTESLGCSVEGTAKIEGLFDLVVPNPEAPRCRETLRVQEQQRIAMRPLGDGEQGFRAVGATGIEPVTSAV